MNSTGNAAGEADPRRWRALWICLVAGFMTLLDVSIVNVALPSMEHGIGATPADVSWVVSGYALTFGLALVPAGRLGDDYGRRKMFLLGLLLFVATSALCGAAQNATWLVVARLCQGIAGGLLNPQVIGMIQQLFSGRERGRAFGLFGATVGLSTAVGPVLGGLLIQGLGIDEGWRYVFYVNLPIGLLAIVFGARLLPRDTRTGPRRAPDLLGTLLLGLAVVSVMLPLVEAEEATSAPRWWLMGVGAVLLVVFVLWERRARHPLVNLRLLTVRSYAMGALLGLVYFAGFTGIFLVTTLFFQQGLGYSPLEAGAATLAFAIGSAISPAIGGRIVHRFGRPMVVLGILLVVVGLGVTAWLVGEYTGANAALVLGGPLFVAGFGSGLVIAPNQTLSLEEVPPAEGGTAAGVLQTAQRVGAAIGTALGGSLFFAQLARSHGDYHSSAAHGLIGSVALVTLALVVGVGDIALSARRRRRKAPAAPAAPVVRGTVTGAPATLTLTSLRTNRAQRVTTDADGRFELPAEPGPYLLLAAARGQDTLARELRVGDAAVTADFAFPRVARLSGVVEAAGGPVARASVALLDAGGEVAQVAVTDERGHYRIDGLRPGEYTVVTTGYAPTASPVRVEGRRTRHDPLLVLPAAQPERGHTARARP
ncbi:MFS transporter [Amycolatopsis acidiphila]|uniref:MFS transporter n=1 Tax=Amycolatopsis acidiphila TaxID=715473 RepID=UPI001F477830|nr:MFS transporter [Amycolatopsis acidiphila]